VQTPQNESDFPATITKTPCSTAEKRRIPDQNRANCGANPPEFL
jgi:hypothetical protein